MFCSNAVSTQRAIYKKEEFEAQNTSKRSSDDHDLSCSPRTGGPSTQGSGLSPMQSRGRTISDFLDQGGGDGVDSKVYWFLYACGIPFKFLHSPYWHETVEAIRTAPVGYKSPGYEKARTVGLDKEKAKIQNALGKITNAWKVWGINCIRWLDQCKR